MTNNSITQMQKIVLGLAGVMSAFAITVPIAMLRVSSTAKFAGQPFNSQTCETANPAQRQVVNWLETCSRMSIAPLNRDRSNLSPTQLPAGIPVVAPSR